MTDTTCKHCFSPLEAGAERCAACGRAVRSAGRVWMIGAVAGGVLMLVVLGLWLLGRSSQRAKGSHNPRYVKEIDPTDGAIALESSKPFTLDYLDKGSAIELGINTNEANPVLYVDVNQNGLSDAGDLSYAADGNRACVNRLGTDGESGTCDVASHATVSSQQSGDSRRVTWTIPKSEIQSTGSGADVVIETFHERTQTGEYYPDAHLFQHVYHLEFVPGAPLAMQDDHSALPSPTAAAPEAPVARQHAPSQPATPIARAEPVPEILDFAASASSIPSGGSAKLNWSVRHGSSVEIEPGLGNVALEGEQNVSPQQTTRYILTAKGPGGVLTRELTVAVQTAPAPQIESFLSDTGNLTAGGTARLSWLVTGSVTKVALSPGFDALPAKGERTVMVNATTDYVLTAEGPGGTSTAKLTVRAATAPPVIAFEAAPSNLRPGEGTMLQWNVTGADRVELSPGVGVVAASGSLPLRPISNVRYTLTAQGPDGTSVRDVTIFVARPAGASSGQIVWSGMVRGLQLVTIDGNHADSGELQGALPGLPCIVQPADEKSVSIASTPGPRNNYSRMLLRVKGNGFVRVVLNWSLQ